MQKILTAAAVAALVAAPVGAATRPAAAVPAVSAASSSAALQDEDDYGWDAGTVIIGILAAGLIIWGIIELLDDEDDGDLPLSLA